MGKEIVLVCVWLFAIGTTLAPRVPKWFMLMAFGTAIIFSWHFL